MDGDLSLLKKIDYLSTIEVGHDLENTWKPIAIEVVDMINNNISTNRTLLNENIYAIPDGVVRSFILERI